MKIAIWNVNSVRARLENVEKWLKENPVDVLLLQELKCVDKDFPAETFDNLGYNYAIFGQKTYNGVAILSKTPIEDVVCGIPGFEDEQSRYIEAVIGTKRIVSVYVPNGSDLESDKYQYKLKFLEALYIHLKDILSYKEEVIIGGDYNIAPHDLDIYDPKKWKGNVICSVPERLAFNKILNLGYTDAFKALYPDTQEFTWWDYRHGAFPKNLGLRIDHFLLSPEATDILEDVFVDKGPRSLDKASDHAPVILTLKDQMAFDKQS